uniref:Uncharacterized protein n=1 Tax=Romanomermis culicivorax TaxID=13658 RepID=A0A915JG79_ROMCU
MLFWKQPTIFKTLTIVITAIYAKLKNILLRSCLAYSQKIVEQKSKIMSLELKNMNLEHQVNQYRGKSMDCAKNQDAKLDCSSDATKTVEGGNASRSEFICMKKEPINFKSVNTNRSSCQITKSGIYHYNMIKVKDNQDYKEKACTQ